MIFYPSLGICCLSLIALVGQLVELHETRSRYFRINKALRTTSPVLATRDGVELRSCLTECTAEGSGCIGVIVHRDSGQCQLFGGAEENENVIEVSWDLAWDLVHDRGTYIIYL